MSILKNVEMTVDFRKSTLMLPLLTITNSTVLAVESFSFLSSTVSQEVLKWKTYIDFNVKKEAQQKELRTLDCYWRILQGSSLLL